MKRKEYILLLLFRLSWFCFQPRTSLMLKKKKTFYVSLLHNSELSVMTLWGLHWCKNTKFRTGAIIFFHNSTYNLPQAAIFRGVSPASG